jgi:hypothetical protein
MQFVPESWIYCTVRIERVGVLHMESQKEGQASFAVLMALKIPRRKLGNSYSEYFLRF